MSKDHFAFTKRANPEGGQADTSTLEGEIDQLVAARSVVWVDGG